MEKKYIGGFTQILYTSQHADLMAGIIHLLVFFFGHAVFIGAVPYLIDQRSKVDGSVEIYSPYFLWLDQLYDTYPPGGEALSQPFKVFSVSGRLDITLTVESFTLSTPLFNFNTRAFCFNDICKVPGPTLICQPGDIIQIKLLNNLQKDSVGSNSSIFPDEVFFPNRTNIFFPSMPFDSTQNSPYVYTEGDGDSVQYKFKIPSNQPPGLHWYQSRVNGVSALQVMGGLFGGLIIQQTTTYFNPSSFNSLPRELLVLHHIMLDTPMPSPLANIPSGSFSLIDEDFETSSLSLTYLSKAYGSKMLLQASYYTSTVTNQVRDAWLTNNQFMPFISFGSATWAAFDIIVASTDRIVQLEIRSQIGYGKGTQSCEMLVMSRNGYYYPTTRQRSSLLLMQGDRATIAISCASAGTYYLQSVATFNASDPRSRVGDFTTQSSQVLMVLEISGGVTPSNVTAIINSLAPPTDQSFLTTSVPNYVNATVAGMQSISTAQNSVAFRQESSSCGGDIAVGAGETCVLPCYDDILCSALFGSDIYTVNTYPVALNGDCSFQSANIAAGHICQNSSSQSTVQNWTVANDKTMVLQLNLFGTESFAYPITLQGRAMQLMSFSPPNATTANILQRDEYTPSYYDFTYADIYGVEEGDISESWPAPPGQSSFLFQAGTIQQPFHILTPYLKFEDRGFLRKIQILAVEAINSSSGGSGSGGTSTGTSTAVPSIAAMNATPYAYDVNPDSATEEFLCQVNGSSFLYNEALNDTSKQRLLTVNSCPNHFSICQSEECGGPVKTRALLNRKEYSIPMYPVLAASPTDTTCVTGQPLGVALNGVGIYGPADGSQLCVTTDNVTSTPTSRFGRTSCISTNRGTGYLRCGDSLPFIAQQIDKCGGYEPRTGGFYQYRTLPRCLMTQLTNARQIQPTSAISRIHSVQLGWAMDGFPIYGPRGAIGIIMKPCGTTGAHPQLCLDACNGYKGRLPGVDEFLYRYYLTSTDSTDLGAIGSSTLTPPRCSSVINGAGQCQRLTDRCCFATEPPQSLYPYTIGCYRGCVAGDYACYATSQRGFTADYVPIATSSAPGIDARSYDNAPSGDDQTISESVTNTTFNSNIDPEWTSIRLDRPILTRSSPTAPLKLLKVDESVLLNDDASQGNGFVEEASSLSPNSLFHSFSLDSTQDRLFIATEKAIIATPVQNLDGSEAVTLISSPMVVDIAGVNLGLLRADILYIQVNGRPCTSILHISSSLLQCTMPISDISYSYTINDIEVRTVSGVARGLNLDAVSVQNSGSMRPALTQAAFSSLAFSPRAISFLPNSSYVATDSAALQGTIYFTSVAGNGLDDLARPGLYRAMADGSNIEAVTNGIQRGYGLAVLEQYVDASTLAVISDQDQAAVDFQAQPALCRDSSWDNSNIGDIITDGGYAPLILNKTYTISSATFVNTAVASASGKFTSSSQSSSRTAFASKCQILVGHVTFIADSESFGSLSRVTVLPAAVTMAILNPSLTSQSALWLQDTTEPLLDALLVTAIVQRVMGASALSLDYSSVIGSIVQPSLWLTLQEGVLIQLDLQTMLLITDDSTTVNVSSYNAEQRKLQSTADLSMAANDSTSNGSGLTIFREQDIGSSNSTMNSTSTSGLSLPYLFNALGVIYDFTNATKSLPSWMTATPLGNVDGRWTAVAAVPIDDLFLCSNASVISSRAALHQRIILLDIAQQLLIVSDTQTLRPSNINLGKKFGVWLPRALQYYKFNKAVNGSSSAVEVLVMETLGRVWLVSLPLITGTGINEDVLRFNLDSMTAPTLLLDQSASSTSASLQNLLVEARDSGKPASSAFFFEASR